MRLDKRKEVVLKTTPGWVEPSTYERKSMTSTSQPKLVNHATMPEMGSSLLSVVLAYQTVLFLPWKTISPYL